MKRFLIKNGIKVIAKFFLEDKIEMLKNYLYYKYIAKIDIKKGYETRKEQFEELFS